MTDRELIDPEDLKVETYNPWPPGGQHVGAYRGVHVEHLPTGTIAICQSCRSQHRNRTIAKRMIESALTDPDFQA